MFVQAGRDCSMTQQEEATGCYTFRATVGKATTTFTIASTVPTQTFVTMMNNRNKCFLLLSIDGAGAYSPKQ